jgi:hypothetical protein
VKSQIPILQFKRLLHELRDSRPDIGIRVRLMGEMWKSSHFKVFQVTEKGVALYDEATKRLVMVSDLSQIMQFELEQSFQQYEPHFHYSVDPVLVSY